MKLFSPDIQSRTPVHFTIGVINTTEEAIPPLVFLFTLLGRLGHDPSFKVVTQLPGGSLELEGIPGVCMKPHTETSQLLALYSKFEQERCFIIPRGWFQLMPLIEETGGWRNYQEVLNKKRAELLDCPVGGQVAFDPDDEWLKEHLIGMFAISFTEDVRLMAELLDKPTSLRKGVRELLL